MTKIRMEGPRWDEAEARWRHEGTTETWYFTLVKGALTVKASHRIIDGVAHYVMPSRSDVKLLRKELLRRYGRDAVGGGVFNNEGDYDFALKDAAD